MRIPGFLIEWDRQSRLDWAMEQAVLAFSVGWPRWGLLRFGVYATSGFGGITVALGYWALIVEWDKRMLIDYDLDREGGR